MKHPWKVQLLPSYSIWSGLPRGPGTRRDAQNR